MVILDELRSIDLDGGSAPLSTTRAPLDTGIGSLALRRSRRVRDATHRR